MYAARAFKLQLRRWIEGYFQINARCACEFCTSLWNKVSPEAAA